MHIHVIEQPVHIMGIEMKYTYIIKVKYEYDIIV